ncbi:MAG: serine hydrolase [Hyphomonadaceae bacterium]
MRLTHALLAALLALPLAACAQTQETTPQVETAAAWNQQALAQAVDYARDQNTSGFLIVQHGKTIAEENWPLPDDAAQFRDLFTYGTAADGALLEDVASQQKSFIAILVGVAVDKGLVDVSKPASAYLGEGWSKASPEQEAGITVLNLLQMNSGLNEQYGYEVPAGTKFFYNTPVYAALKPVLEKATGRDLADLTHDWLTEPVGMTETAWRQRPAAIAGASGNATGLVTTPRDVARMGQLVLDGGVAASGKRVISKAQLDAMFEHSPTNPSYGRLWWLNGGAYSISPGGDAKPRDGQLIASAPGDLVAALGAYDRKLFVVPSLDLVVVRMGRATPDRDFNDQLWRLLTAALPPA